MTATEAVRRVMACPKVWHQVVCKAARLSGHDLD